MVSENLKEEKYILVNLAREYVNMAKVIIISF